LLGSSKAGPPTPLAPSEPCPAESGPSAGLLFPIRCRSRVRSRRRWSSSKANCLTAMASALSRSGASTEPRYSPRLCMMMTRCSCSFEFQGPCSASTAWRARIRYTQALALPAHTRNLSSGMWPPAPAARRPGTPIGPLRRHQGRSLPDAPRENAPSPPRLYFFEACRGIL
jgi:hypothetical protein